MAQQQLEIARKDLLDLSARNRLINTRRSSTRSTRLEIVDEISDQVFQMLVTKGKAMTFLAKPKPKNPDGEEEQPDEFEEIDYETISFAQPDEELEEGEVPARHRDDKLQTTLKSEKLQKKLLRLFYDARTFEEEQGVNTLYLAIGFLKWFEDEKSDVERQSPLILVPVQLERRSVGTRFRIAWDEGEIATNLSLQAKLQSNFGIALPDIDADAEDFSPSEYFERVAKAIDIKPKWEILPNSMVTWFFSFAKFLMYKDMAPEHWPVGKKISDHPLVSSLVGSGFTNEPPLCGEEENIDDFLDPLDMVHVVPADSSQTMAIEEAKQGRNLVIQGPPGTGKSQTITNIVAAAVERGMKVLFVSEKMAALQVVKQRLDDIHLGGLCLELHSNKSNKRAVLQEIERTLALGRPKTERIGLNAEELRTSRDRLNLHAKQMHTQIEQSGKTTFQALGELVRLKSEGTKIATFNLDEPEKWKETAFNENRGLLKDLQVHLAEIGNPAEHIWRGASIGTLLPTDNQRIQDQISEAIARIDAVRSAGRKIAATFDVHEPDSFSAAVSVANMARAACKIPSNTDRDCIHGTAWEKQELLTETIEHGHNAEQIKAELESVVSSSGWDADLITTRRNLKAHGKSWFRFFNSNYRNAKATLAGILNGDLPKSLDEQVELLDKIITVQTAKAKLNDADALAKSAFGEQWMGQHSNWEGLTAIAQWRKECATLDLPDDFFEKLANVSNTDLVKPLKEMRKELNPSLTETKTLLKTLSFDLKRGFQSEDLKSLSLTTISERLATWVGKEEELSKWGAFFSRLKRLPKNGMSELAQNIYAGEISDAELVPQFQQAYNESLVRCAYKRFPQLASFSGKTHETALEKFKKLNEERYLLSRQQVALAHYKSFPHTAAEIGEVGILKHEIKKKRRHMPIRRLLASAGHAVQAIKPVFMMSPISIAQFLKPGVLEFDLLLFDEASQVKPVDAFGAIARSRQMVVVGDEKQLPPTSFFDNVVSEDEEEDPDAARTADIESILGLCSAQSMNERMLRWHYRSRHHSLIAVSNHEFYNDQLFIVPSPSEISESLGLSFVHVKDGVFDRGKSRTNAKEAQTVADAAMKHAENFPNMTLGIGAFSVAQRDAILDEVELRLLKRPDLQPFFAPGKQEAFFVKNLENIQGDERDVIFISIGYGYDENGKDSMNFGPIGKDGGERRLNVLITRAKSRCVVFSSITANYIDLKRTKATGTAALKTYLHYAQTGEFGVAESSDRGFDSEFERQVAKALQSRGYDVRPQIGDAGFFVDLAIVDEEFPGRFLLGIECDGASYHSSRSARDRDQIRQAILEDRGWIIHRIWSTDWFQRPEEQLRSVCEAIEEAKIKWAARDAQSEADMMAARPDPKPEWELTREEQPATDLPARTAVETVAYQEASFPRPSDQEIHELPPAQLGTVVESVVRIEGPIHRGELARRMAQLWDQNRAGRRIVESVEESIEFMAGEKRILVSEDFVSIPNQPIEIRNREAVLTGNIKKPENIPPAEIKEALVKVIKANIGILQEEAIKEVSRLMGFRSTSSKLKGVIQPVLDSVCLEFEFQIKNERIYDV